MNDEESQKYFKEPIRALATKLMNEKGISWRQAMKLVWNDLILIVQFVDDHYPELTKEQKSYEVGGRFDAFLKGEYDLHNG